MQLINGVPNACEGVDLAMVKLRRTQRLREEILLSPSSLTSILVHLAPSNARVARVHSGWAACWRTVLARLQVPLMKVTRGNCTKLVSGHFDRFEKSNPPVLPLADGRLCIADNGLLRVWNESRSVEREFDLPGSEDGRRRCTPYALLAHGDALLVSSEILEKRSGASVPTMAMSLL